MTSEDRTIPRRSLPAMALVSCAVLVYEIALTRVLSAIVWYHFAFLSVSLAMLGLGVPGVWFALRRSRPGTPWGLLLAAGAAVPVSIAVLVKIVAPIGAVDLGDVTSLTMQASTPLAKTTAIVGTVLVPLLLLGGAVCWFLMAAPGARVGRMYAADLLGAAVGAVSVVPLLHVIPTPSLLAACGFLPLAAALLVRRDARRAPIAVALALTAALAWGEPFRLRHTKSYDETNLEMMHERWTPTARLTVFPRPFFVPRPEVAFGWGMGSKFPGGEIEQLWIEQDGSAGTPVTRLVGPPESLDHLFYDVTSVGYQLRPPESVGIIGAGGGRDILASLGAGATTVDAVELNPYMVALVSDRYGDFSGDPYHLPGVREFRREGRSFLTQTEERYDLLQIALTDSWAATAAGAYALSENYLYTREAFELYWSRLAPDGMVSISRWMYGEARMEVPRLAVLAWKTLEGLGVESPRDHLAVLAGGLVANLLISRTPFTGADVQRLDAIAAERGFTRLWPPPTGGPPANLVGFVLERGHAALAKQGFHLAPPTDERPFFFQTVRPFSSIPEGLAGTLSVNEEAALLPRNLILIVGAVTLGLFFAPFLFERLEAGGGFWRGSAYFVAIGLGFLLVEVPFLQRFVLYLGHPSYATTVVLSTLLLGSGIGSAAAGRLTPAAVHRLRFLLPLAVAAVALGLRAVFTSSIGWPLPARILVSLAILAPLGFLMGMPFPAGMIRFADRQRPWFWALNGASSVLASVSSVALASYVGLTGVAWIGVGCYVLACALLPRLPGS